MPYGTFLGPDGLPFKSRLRRHRPANGPARRRLTRIGAVVSEKNTDLSTISVALNSQNERSVVCLFSSIETIGNAAPWGMVCHKATGAWRVSLSMRAPQGVAGM